MYSMNKKQKSLIITTICAVVLLALPFSSAFAEDDGFTDTFDDPELTGWDRSPEAIVTEGVLRIGPGNIAIREGNFVNFSATFDVKFSGDGILFFRFNMREGEDYACIFFQESIVVERTKDGQPQQLGGFDGWSGFSGDWDTVQVSANSGSIEISVNDNLLVEAQDTGTPIGGGALGFIAEGESSVDIDNVSVTVLAGGEGAAEGPIEEQAAPAPAPTAVPTAPSGIEGILAQLTESRGSPPEISIIAVNLLLSVLMAFILSRVYVHWGSALSNRRRFAANFILITITTTFIILIVRSSVALSLGLVGALSIVRFRAAIKEPEELAYLFFAIGIGIGLGDNQRLITVLALAVVVIVIAIMRLFRGRQADFNLHLTVASANPGKLTLDEVKKTLRGNTAQSRLIRFDENKDALEASFLVEFRNSAQLEAAKNALQALSEEIEITFLDNKGIG